MGSLQMKLGFIQTFRNVRNFMDFMAGLMRNFGDAAMGLLWGRAGVGKSRTVQWSYANSSDSAYLYVRKIWRSSELAFMQGLAMELGCGTPPCRKNTCFQEVLSRLVDQPRVVFLDEIETMSSSVLGLIRDWTELSGCGFILVGEEPIYDWVARERRVWSRIVEQLEFKPLDVPEIIHFAREAGGLRLSAESAQIFHKASGGDLRITKRDLGAAIRFVNTKGGDPEGVTPEVAKMAVRAGIRGAKP